MSEAVHQSHGKGNNKRLKEEQLDRYLGLKAWWSMHLADNPLKIAAL